MQDLKNDPVMKKLIEKHGPIELKRNNDYFESLVQSIIYQQLHSKAAESIHNKFLSLFKGPITARKVLKIDEEKMSSIGLSRQKTSYLKSLAEYFARGKINPGKFHEMGDEDIINELTKVKGIGEWTAQMFLIFSLARKDVFAPKDFGLRKAIMLNYGMEGMPSPKEAEEFSRKWSPFRTYASLYLWKSTDE